MSAFIVGATISLVKMMCFHNFKERIYYFASYMTDIILTGKWKLYESGEGTSFGEGDAGKQSLKIPKQKIHFALPVFLGVAIYIGGVI